ncbi:hypothetical protein ESN35_06175 [Bifidobacterium pullorum subsp. gallinarum]|uniref:Uncharacterized protein n=1 Tax=Bifidobacterium pullorum subsp. gallinarum TaxID=78344 RepID=A0A4P6DU74_9BIFI|nr:hypothetical protein [Bifidobacterium pullorum]QAY33035.1 hypothetical protein ESN35_06175 [Bifidobacterium pullorum subsp. gallinarum]
MTIFNDENRTVEIVITTWDETIGQWSADWSEYFYDAVAKDVKDVQYCIDQATDMRDGKGDYLQDGPRPGVDVTVTELDHGDYMRGHMVRASDPADPTGIAMSGTSSMGVAL